MTEKKRHDDARDADFDDDEEIGRLQEQRKTLFQKREHHQQQQNDANEEEEEDEENATTTNRKKRALKSFVAPANAFGIDDSMVTNDENLLRMARLPETGRFYPNLTACSHQLHDLIVSARC